MNGYFRDWIVHTMIVWLLVFSIAGILTFLARGFMWLWRKAFRDPPWPTTQAVSGYPCPHCRSIETHLLFGSHDAYSCDDCGRSWWQ